MFWNLLVIVFNLVVDIFNLLALFNLVFIVFNLPSAVLISVVKYYAEKEVYESVECVKGQKKKEN